MTELRFALITQMRARGMQWKAIAREFHVKDSEGFAQTYRNERDRREAAPLVRLLQRAAK